MFKSILVPVDSSALSRKSMKAAVELAKQGGGKLIALSVAEPRMFHSTDTEAVHDARTAEAINVEATKGNIRKALQSVGEVGVPWEGVVSVSGAPCDAILETARRFQCDLIVMATRGKMGVLETFFNESTTREVLSKSSIPVLVFPDS
jgi:nucleotide-binding universal stress UspA family protein